MNENAKKWVAALRSGKYKQGKGRLRIDNEYCCLGVACEVYQEEVGNLIIEKAESADTYRYGSMLNAFTTTVLPIPVMEWLGLTTEAGEWGVSASIALRDGCLSQMNDDGASFEEIADLVESEPVGLFTDESS